MIPALIAAILATAGFVAGFVALGVVPAARRALSGAQDGVSAMLDPELDDDAKETAVQRAGLALLGAVVAVAWRFALTLAAAAAPVWALDLLGVVPADDALDLMLGWEFLVGATVLVGGGAWAWSRRAGAKARAEASGAAASAYSAGDRILHAVAFAGPGVQRAAARLEGRLFSRAIAGAEERAPVFITALPRAGTTVLLNAFHDLPGAATHLYRDMPFVAAPILWSRLTAPVAARGGVRERAHGDGLTVGFDSPEAFEEVLWRIRRPERFEGARLPIWRPGDADPETTAFLRSQFRRIRVARGVAPGGFYVSKNNGNVARLALLPEMFPGCTVITPVRDPAEHAMSLMRQHLNFARQHAEDPFAARYMRDIGHLEFGALHRPIDFPGFDPGATGPEDADYWLRLWIAAHREVLARADGLLIVDHAALCDRPAPIMAALCAAAGVDGAGVDVARHFRPVRRTADRGAFDPALLAEAEDLHAAATARAVTG